MWELNDAYTKFMLAATVKKTLLSGTALHFNLVLGGRRSPPPLIRWP